MVVIHLIALAFSAVIILLADKQGFAWMRGRVETLNPKSVHRLHVATWVGLCTLILTGGIMAYPMIDVLLTNTHFLAKMLFVSVLLLNGILIGRLSEVATKQSFASLSRAARIQFLISGAASATSWIGAATMGFLLFE